MYDPCATGCKYSKDVGMWPKHSCANGNMYEMGIAGPPPTDKEAYKTEAKEGRKDDLLRL